MLVGNNTEQAHIFGVERRRGRDGEGIDRWSRLDHQAMSNPPACNRKRKPVFAGESFGTLVRENS
jgi:hypothetical protein